MGIAALPADPGWLKPHETPYGLIVLLTRQR